MYMFILQYQVELLSLGLGVGVDPHPPSQHVVVPASDEDSLPVVAMVVDAKVVVLTGALVAVWKSGKKADDGQVTKRHTEELWGREGGHEPKEQHAADNLGLHLSADVDCRSIVPPCRLLYCWAGTCLAFGIYLKPLQIRGYEQGMG
jgi:hypothetical protein